MCHTFVLYDPYPSLPSIPPHSSPHCTSLAFLPLFFTNFLLQDFNKIMTLRPLESKSFWHRCDTLLFSHSSPPLLRSPFYLPILPIPPSSSPFLSDVQRIKEARREGLLRTRSDMAVVGDDGEESFLSYWLCMVCHERKRRGGGGREKRGERCKGRDDNRHLSSLFPSPWFLFILLQGVNSKKMSLIVVALGGAIICFGTVCDTCQSKNFKHLPCYSLPLPLSPLSSSFINPHLLSPLPPDTNVISFLVELLVALTVN